MEGGTRAGPRPLVARAAAVNGHTRGLASPQARRRASTHDTGRRPQVTINSPHSAREMSAVTGSRPSTSDTHGRPWRRRTYSSNRPPHRRVLLR